MTAFEQRARRATRGITEPLASLLARLGLSPNALTLAGSGLHVGVAWLLASGRLREGALALLVAAAIDGLDGAVARSTGHVTKLGAFLDSTFDRLSEILVFFGLLIHVQRLGLTTDARLVLLAITGSIMVSYTRARSEALGMGTKAGMFGRLERMVVLVLGLAADRLTLTLVVLTVGAWLTAALRVADVWRTGRRVGAIAEEQGAAGVDAAAAEPDEPSLEGR